MNQYEMVEEFMKKNNIYRCTNNNIRTIPGEVILVRQRLILEELGELSVAIQENKDDTLVTDALCDLAYVLYGAMITVGAKFVDTPTWEMAEPSEAAIEISKKIEIVSMITVECSVTINALASFRPANVGDSALEAVYEIMNACRWYKVPFIECFAEVHASNMTKTFTAAPHQKGNEDPRYKLGDYREPQLTEIIQTYRKSLPWPKC